MYLVTGELVTSQRGCATLDDALWLTTSTCVLCTGMREIWLHTRSNLADGLLSEERNHSRETERLLPGSC
jgi:hypothetical protein